MSKNTGKGPIFDPGVCRCCGALKKCRLLNIEYEWQGQKEIYSDMFVDCFGLLLSHLDEEEVERLICATCVSRLREATSFRQQVLQCEEKLLRTKLHEEEEDSTLNVKLESTVKDELDSIHSGYQDDVISDCLDNEDMVELKDEIIAKPRRKSMRPQIKTKKIKRSKGDVLTKEMLHNAKRLKEKLKEMQDIELPEQSVHQKPNGYKSNDNVKSYYNITTIVENSYACPFDTSFSDFFCVYCRKVFTDPNKLREHSMTHDPRSFKDVLSNTLANKKLQIDIYRIDCRLCPENIDDLDKFIFHIQNIHQINYYSNSNDFLKFRLTPDPPSCTECGATFSFFHALKKHMAEHFGTCICDICGAHYFEERMLILHQKTHQKIEETFTCKECGKTFKSKYTRYIHIARTHKKEAAYHCIKCDEVFFSYTQRYRHMIESHGEERMFKCSQCDRSYDSRKSLREHNRRFHLKIFKHQCDLCEKRFYLPSRLKEHMASHTGERNFKCDYCGKSYPRLRGLKVHMQSHNSEKKYKCALCNASFTQNVNLKNHVKRQHQSVVMEDGYTNRFF